MHYGAGMDYVASGYYASANMIDGYLKYNVFKGVDNADLIDPVTGKLSPNATSKNGTITG